MVRKSTLSVRETIKESMHTFLKTWREFFKFALLMVLLSFAPSIYILGLETINFKNSLYFILGIALLVILYIVFIFYSIRLSITVIQKLRSIIEERTFEFKNNFKLSEDKFWAALFVIIIKGLPQILIGISIFSIGEHFYSNDFQLADLHGQYMAILTGIGFLGIYLTYRLEYALFSVCWGLSVKGSDIKMSWRATKKYKLRQFIIIMIAQLPTFIITILQMMNQLSEMNSQVNYLKSWLLLSITISLTILVYSWSFVVYYTVLRKLGYMKIQDKVIHDTEGREWISY